MELWISLTLALACFLVAGGIVVRRWRLDHRPAAAVSETIAEDAPPPAAKRRRRARIIRSSTPPPPPPPPEVPADAPVTEEVPFEKLLDLVDVNLETRNVALADRYLEEVHARFMENPPLDYYRRKVLLSQLQGDHAAAIEALEQVVKGDPEALESAVQLAELELHHERLDGARQRVEELLASHPDNLPLLHVLAKVHRKANEHELAVAVKQRIHALEQELRMRGELPPDPEAYAPVPPPGDEPRA